MGDREDDLRYRPDVDGLRCVAIVSVLLAHAGLGPFAGGYVGVDVFFVISGFLITRILWDGPATGRGSLATFYARRIRRILPALAVMVAATLATGSLVLGPEQFAGLARSAVATALFASNLWFEAAGKDYFSLDVRLQPLLHTWALAVGAQFYLLFPLLLAALARGGRRRAIAGLALLCVFSFALAEHAILRGNRPTAFFLLHRRAWELGAGAILALAVLPRPRRNVAEGLSLAAALAITVPVVTYDAATRFPAAAALPPVAGTAVLIWLGPGTAVATVLSARPVVFVGLVSYSVYLWHWPILAFDRIVLGPTTPVRALAWIAVSFAVGAASWRWIEHPFHLLPARRATLAAGGAATAALAAVGLAIALSGGLPGRLSPEARAAFAALGDVHPLHGRCRTAGRLGDAGCEIGAARPPGTPADFLLWGDSHAEGVLSAVEAAALRAGKHGLVTVLNGCAPLLHVDRIDAGPPTRCSSCAGAVMAYLAERDDMPLVVLEARWAIVAEGVRPDDPGRPVLIVNRAHRLPSGSAAENFAVFRVGIADTVAAIRATGRQVVLLGGVPEIGWPVPTGLGASRALGVPPPPAPDAAAVMARNARTDAVFTELAADPGVAFVPLAPILCTPACAVADPAGRPAYVDDDHMSRSGAVGLLAKPVHDALWGDQP